MGKSKMGLSTLVGLVLGVSLVAGSVFVSGHAELFWNVPSFLIIVGGTTGSVVIAFPPSRLKTLGPVILRAFKKNNFNLKEDVKTMVALAEISRKEGLLALEDAMDRYTEDEFIRRGIRLIVDGADEEQLRNSLEGATYFMRQRHQKGASMVNMIATTTPALGLLGTYVGLIPMLNSLDDPSVLGPMMALELVSSFYGAFIAYVIFSPLAKRLMIMSEEEEGRRDLLIEGLAAIHQGKNPKLIKEELYAFMNFDISEDVQEENVVEFPRREGVNSL